LWPDHSKHVHLQPLVKHTSTTSAVQDSKKITKLTVPQ
jgi:hypothetical protein